jgi:RNA polymerase sigma-70 factor (ECF subfamily)
MSVTTDEQFFVDAIRLRKPSAFNDFYDHYAPAFYGDIKRTLYEPDACSQTLEVAFCAIWTSINEYDSSKERFFTWALKIVRKRASLKKIDLVLHDIFACQQVPPSFLEMQSAR